LNVAIVVSWLNQYGGAERVLEAVHELLPQAPIYTSMFWPEAMPPDYRTWDIRVSWLDRLPFIHRHHQPFLPLYPLAFEGFDLSAYDVVLSISSGFAHGVITPPSTTHLCYCLTPSRFLWTYPAYAEREAIGPLANALLRPILLWLRQWDRLAADRVDEFIAISTEVQRRIAKVYRRDSALIFPPVDTGRFAQTAPAEDGDYFLVVSRLIPYKRVDLAVKAFTALKLPLLIAGDGRDRARLEALAGPNIRFLGRVPDAELPGLLARCRAFLFPGYEDFGIAPVEAQAAGRPVIAYAAGGALDTVIEGVTGLFFREPTPEALAEAVCRFNPRDFNPDVIRQHARQFDKRVFQRKLMALLEERGQSQGVWNSVPSGPSLYAAGRWS
jgi:glycosyltransferase involved in cell wall biosynthesis